jgi:hypothetical protein
MDKGKVIGMKMAGMSNREIHRKEGYDRDKISEVWSEYNAALARMNDPEADVSGGVYSLNTTTAGTARVTATINNSAPSTTAEITINVTDPAVVFFGYDGQRNRGAHETGEQHRCLPPEQRIKKTKKIMEGQADE